MLQAAKLLLGSFPTEEAALAQCESYARKRDRGQAEPDPPPDVPSAGYLRWTAGPGPAAASADAGRAALLRHKGVAAGALVRRSSGDIAAEPRKRARVIGGDALETHFRLVVVSPLFAGQSLEGRHDLVYAALLEGLWDEVRRPLLPTPLLPPLTRVFGSQEAATRHYEASLPPTIRAAPFRRRGFGLVGPCVRNLPHFRYLPIR